MSSDGALGIVALLCALVIVGRAAVLRGRRGEPVARYAAIWAVVILAAFGVAFLFGGRR